jgi:hypothetical protein
MRCGWGRLHLPSAIELLQRSISTVMAKISQGEIYRGPRPRPLPQYFTGFSMKFERGQYGGVLDTTRQPPLDLSFCSHGVYLTLFQKTSVHALFHEGHNDHVPSPGAATLASLENSKIGSRFDKVSEQISRQTTFYSAIFNAFLLAIEEQGMWYIY